MDVNRYSADWRTRFGEPDASRTEADVAFLRKALPLPAFRRVLDVPCGSGRHTRALAAVGYEVVGVDNDPSVSPNVVADLRELGRLPRDFDAVLNLWASFGYFDDDENRRVLASLADRLRPGGRLVFDVYNREFFERAGDTERELQPGVVERSSVTRGRRRVELRYREGGPPDVFEWQLYAPDELIDLCATLGLHPLTVAAAPELPAMQLVLATRAR